MMPLRAPTDEPAPRVFLTFADSDRTTARTLAQELARRGWPCWSRATQMAGPRSGSDQMIRILPVTLVLATPGVGESAIVRFDLRKARQLSKPVVALAIAPEGLEAAGHLDVPARLVDATSEGLTDAAIDDLAAVLEALGQQRLSRLQYWWQRWRAVRARRVALPPPVGAVSAPLLTDPRPPLPRWALVAAGLLLAGLVASLLLRPAPPDAPEASAPVEAQARALGQTARDPVVTLDRAAQVLEVTIVAMPRYNPARRGERPAIELAIINRSREALPLPPLVGRVEDSQGREIWRSQFRINDGFIGPGETITVQESLDNLPAQPLPLTIAFEASGRLEMKAQGQIQP